MISLQSKCFRHFSLALGFDTHRPTGVSTSSEILIRAAVEETNGSDSMQLGGGGNASINKH